MQIERLLEIIFYLLNQKRATATELAARFHVSKRTIYRDINTISLSGIPIYTTKGKGGGIKLMDTFVLNKSILSEREQKEILSSLHVLLSLKTDETDQTLKKLEAFFSRNAPDWFEVDLTRWGPDSRDSFTSIKTAIFESRVLAFDYYSTYGEKTHRRVEPVKLWFKAHSWYLRGFCLDRNAFRLFKLTRMRNISVMENVFKERVQTEETKTPANIQPERVITDITIKLKIAAEMTYRVYDDFDETQIVKNDDGSFTVTITEFEDHRLYGYILSYGEYAVVLEPENAKHIIKEKAQKIFSAYSENDI